MPQFLRLSRMDMVFPALEKNHKNNSRMLWTLWVVCTYIRLYLFKGNACNFISSLSRTGKGAK